MIIEFHDVVLIYSFVSIFLTLAWRNVKFVRNRLFLEVTCYCMFVKFTINPLNIFVRSVHDYSLRKQTSPDI